MHIYSRSGRLSRMAVLLVLTASNLWSQPLNKTWSSATWMDGQVDRNRFHNYRRVFPASARNRHPITSTPHFVGQNKSNGPAQRQGTQKLAFVGPQEGEKSQTVVPVVKSGTVTLSNLVSPSEPSFLIKRRVRNVSVS